MSSEQEEDRKEYVQREEPLNPPAPVIVQSGTPVREVVRESNPPIIATTQPGSERRESVVRKTNTNVGAIVAMIVGAVILIFGIFLIFDKVFPYLTYPWSLLAILIVAIVLIAVGGSLLQNRSSSF